MWTSILIILSLCLTFLFIYIIFYRREIISRFIENIKKRRLYDYDLTLLTESDLKIKKKEEDKKLWRDSYRVITYKERQAEDAEKQKSDDMVNISEQSDFQINLSQVVQKLNEKIHEFWARCRNAYYRTKQRRAVITDRQSVAIESLPDSPPDISDIIRGLEQFDIQQEGDRDLSGIIAKLKEWEKTSSSYERIATYLEKRLEIHISDKDKYVDRVLREVDNFKDDYDKNEKALVYIAGILNIQNPPLNRLFEELEAVHKKSDHFDRLQNDLAVFKRDLEQMFRNMLPDKTDSLNDKNLNELSELIQEKLTAVETLHENELAKYRNRVVQNPELQDENAYLPLYMQNYEILLHYMFQNFNEIYTKIHPDSKFRELFQSVMYGERENGGLKAAIERMGQEGKREALLEVLGIAELRDISKRDFYQKYIKRSFVPVLHNFMKICLYRWIDFQGMNIAEHYQKDGIDIDLLDEICGYMKGSLRMNFGIRLSQIRLFQDSFDADIHQDSFGSSTLISIFPEYKAAQHKLERNIIYDIWLIGIISEELDLHIKPKVVCKI